MSQIKLENYVNDQATIEAMNIRVCPYRNRNYTVNYTRDDEGKIGTTADIDHFYCKSKYPIVSMYKLSRSKKDNR